MTELRPFRFGVQASSAPNRSAWVELARRVEAHGYSTLTLPDHFSDQLAPVPALMAAADATTTLRVGALVLDNDYKHPVVLAKELATIDLLSDGRLEIGIGAGWMRTDYDAAGLAVRPARRARSTASWRGSAVLKGLFADGSVHASRASTTRSATSTAARSPSSGRGRPSSSAAAAGGSSAIAAREADIVGINGTLRSGAIDADALATHVGGRRRREARAGCARPPATGSTEHRAERALVLRRRSPTSATAPPPASASMIGFARGRRARHPVRADRHAGPARRRPA